MTYSGIIKDPAANTMLRGPYPVRLIAFTLVACALGWAFTVYMPQIADLGWRIALGFGMSFVLVLMTNSVSYIQGERMFAAICMGAGFAAGMWGLWAQSEYGDIPTIAQVQTSAEGKVYSMLAFGEPFEVSGYIFELWIGMTAFFAAVPLLASFARPRPKTARQNPFRIHPDFAQPFFPRLVFLPLTAFGIAAGSVYAYPYVQEYELPLEIVCIPPLVVAFLFAKLHMTFIKALLISIIGGAAGAAGFWGPWLYMTYGEEAAIAFVTGTPQDILLRVEELAQGYSYSSTAFGNTTDYTAWTFEIWAGLTIAYLCLPTVVTLSRRFFNFARS